MSDYSDEFLEEEYAEVAVVLADLTDFEPPSGLRTAAMLAAAARRRPGRPTDAATPATPAVCFERTSADLRALLTSLSDAEWQTIAHPEHGSIRNLAQHLVGIERLGAEWLDAAAAPSHNAIADHIQVAAAASADLDGATPAQLVEELARAAEGVLRAAGSGDPQRAVTGYGLPTDVGGYLLIRTFELWAHSVDIARATGRPESQLDAERLAAMTGLLIPAIPTTLAVAGIAAPGRTARLVLTGPAGGAYSVPLDPASAPGEPDVVVLTDPISICLRAADRLAADDVPVEWDGDEALGRRMLSALHVFAAD